MWRRSRLGSLEHAADFIILAAFLGLAVLGYDRLFAGIGELVAAPDAPQFSALYAPGQNPWAGIMPDQAPAHTRFASANRVLPPYR
jgi:hypothetical protein